jgi:hypothetical protein
MLRILNLNKVLCKGSFLPLSKKKKSVLSLCSSVFNLSVHFSYFSQHLKYKCRAHIPFKSKTQA